MRKVYIAGPMRGYKDFNFDAFDRAAHELRRDGYVAISPTDLDRIHEGWIDYPPEQWEFSLEGDAARMIRRDLDAIMNCDAIYMLTGWERSKGALVEKALAEFLGLEIMYQ